MANISFADFALQCIEDTGIGSACENGIYLRNAEEKGWICTEVVGNQFMKNYYELVQMLFSYHLNHSYAGQSFVNLS